MATPLLPVPTASAHSTPVASTEAGDGPSLLRYAWAQWPRYTAGAVALAFTNGLGLVIPWMLKLSIDTLLAPSHQSLGRIARYAWAIVALAAAQAAIRTLSRVLIFNGGREVEYRLRGDLFRHVLRLPQSFHRAHPTGELMSRHTNDLSAVRMLFGPGVLNIANTSLVYVTGLYLMSTLSGRLTLFAVIPLPLVVISARFASRKIFHQSRDLQAQMAQISNHLQEDLNGIATLRAYTLEAQRHQLFAGLSQGYLNKSLALVRTRGLLGPQFAVAAGLGTSIVLWVGGREVIAGRMTVGGLVAFNAYFVYLAWPTLALGWVLSLWQRGLAGWQRVKEILVMAPSEQYRAPSHVPGADVAAPVEIVARDLTITLDGERILSGLNFCLRAGQTTAIVGRTGSGKSTLTDALVRLVDVPPQSLFFNGQDITDISLSILRAQIAYAPQDPFLFSASIADNIAFGRRWPGVGSPRSADEHDASQRAAVAQAAQDAGLARDLLELPNGLDTLVGERGITLSGGQRQRVALARALYADTPLVVLDDSLSSVDAETEQTILAQLRSHLGRRTAVIVSHRVAAVRHAHEILVLEKGKIVERGQHEQLLGAGGTYCALYQEQRKQEIERSTLEVAT